MSDVLPTTGWEIQIKQRGGKWVRWCYRTTDVDMLATWNGIAALRRKARLLALNGELPVAIVAKYEPPAVQS